MSQNTPIRLLEAKNEKANGNDIELFIENSSGDFILFPTQAKCIYPSGQYEQINHKNNISGTFQIDLLLNYALKKGGVPIYLLYNNYDWKDLHNLKKQLSFPVEFLGCSLVNAHHISNQYTQRKTPSNQIERWEMPGFFDLHPIPAIPLYKIEEITKSDIVLNSLWHESKAHVKELSVYTKDEVFDEEKWKDLTPPPAIGRNASEIEEFLKVDLPKEESFNPKFRLVFLRENSVHQKGTITIMW